mgnify:CR=1 FL=1
METGVLLTYILLFGSAFLAATILPFYSEVVLFGLLRQGGDPLMLLLVAAAGNTLGAVVNWWLGRYLLQFQDKKWFYFTRDQIEQAQKWFQRYGYWTLLLAWMPVAGDPLTLIAGVMNVRLTLFIPLVAAGKGLRYLAVIYLGLWWP